MASGPKRWRAAGLEHLEASGRIGGDRLERGVTEGLHPSEGDHLVGGEIEGSAFMGFVVAVEDDEPDLDAQTLQNAHAEGTGLHLGDDHLPQPV